MLKKLLHLTESHKKLYSHNEYKKCRNMLSTLLKRSKQGYFSKLFESNWNNIKNTWKGIKSLFTLKDISISVPRTLNHHNSTDANPVEIANIFNNFASVTEKAKANANYQHKNASKYREHKSFTSTFLSPSNKNRISGIISSLNPNKSVGPKSIPTKILKLLKDEIPFHLSASLISFSMGVFSSSLCIKKLQT